MSISKDFASLANQGVSAAEFGKLDGVTATTAELNALDVSEASGADATTFLRGDATWAVPATPAAAAGTVVQVQRASIVSTATSGGAITYTTAAGAVSATLDTNGIWRWKNADGDYLTIPSFSASSGNMVVGWWSGGGVNSAGTAASFSLGIEWGSAARRTFSHGGGHFTDQYYPGPINHHSSYILDGDLSNVNVHAIIKINNSSNTFAVRVETGFYNTSTANFAQWGASDGVVYHMTIMEIKQ